MSSYVLDFQDIDKAMLMTVGGKGANLGELARIKGIHVPSGFCITTAAFQRLLEEHPTLNSLLEQLSGLTADDREQIRTLSAMLRTCIEEQTIPEDIKTEIIQHLCLLGEKDAYAIRSSATVEDLPTASFAGQQDTYLNIIGKEAVLRHIRKCFASLYTERAVVYRLQNGFDHRKVHLSVVIQRMVLPQASGILFTADPISGNRKLLSVDAGFGLGEALVSGLVNADHYSIHDGKIREKKVSSKKLEIYALQEGGTKTQEVEVNRQNIQVLTDEQILQLERIGRKIEAHYGCPQDLEWCLADGLFYIVQSRPITTLYPIPDGKDGEKHVYLSVGHQQMMTDALKPLGISFMELISFGQRYKAGGRLFVDVAQMLASQDSRAMLLNNMGQHDPLMKDALMTIIERDFIQCVPNDKQEQSDSNNNHTVPSTASEEQLECDPAIVTDLIKKSQASIKELKQKIQTKSGSDLFDFILEDIVELKRILFDPQSTAVFVAAIDASLWINEKMNEWLGEKNAADTLTQSVPNNITSEMGLALMEVADSIRPFPEVITYLQKVKEDTFLEELVQLPGGQETRDAILAYLSKYGMRCSGEIDITRTRFSEKPSTLIPILLNNIKNFEPGAGYQKFEHGRLEALKKEQELLDRLKLLPDGELKARETKRRIDLVRNYIGYREYPKYGMVCRYFIYKQALLKEAEQLVQKNVLQEKEDIYYLTLEEFHEAVRVQKQDDRIIQNRKEEFKSYEKLTPPRVITSEGEVFSGNYHRGKLPADALAGLSVSSGIAEGRARVILNMEEAVLEEGDILVTSYTDPSWTPLFVAVKGLVTEVGGLMTHGAVIAREYGLPAVVGVEHATDLIKDGQKIRVNAVEGYVEILT